MSTTYEHKTIPGIEFGALHPILSLGGRKLRPLDGGIETKQAGDYEDALTEARARLAGDGDIDRDDDGGDDDDGEEDAMLPDRELPAVGADEVVVMEAPLESLTEATRKTVVLAHLVAQEHLPPPGPPPGLRVRFSVPYLKSTAEAYESLTGRPVVPFVVGKAWGGHFDPNTNQAWVDVGPYGGELPRHVLHELCHAWRFRTPGYSTMTAEAMEEEAWAWTEALLPKVFELANGQGEAA